MMTASSFMSIVPGTVFVMSASSVEMEWQPFPRAPARARFEMIGFDSEGLRSVNWTDDKLETPALDRRTAEAAALGALSGRRPPLPQPQAHRGDAGAGQGLSRVAA